MFRQILWTGLAMLPFSIMAQSVTQQLLSPYGSFQSASGISVTATLGEPFINTYHTGAIALTEGAQQPIGPGVPLPIRLISFTAKLITNNSQTQLEWATGEEENSDRFEILKSADGQNFGLYQSVPSKGNSSLKQSYMALDLAPFDGRTFYRLRQVDLDGQSSLSPIVSVERHVSDILKIYPQPAMDRLYISFSSTVIQDLEWDLFDVSGRLLQSKNITAVEGVNTMEWGIESLTAGLYFIKCRNSTRPAFKVIKQ